MPAPGLSLVFQWPLRSRCQLPRQWSPPSAAVRSWSCRRVLPFVLGRTARRRLRLPRAASSILYSASSLNSPLCSRNPRPGPVIRQVRAVVGPRFRFPLYPGPGPAESRLGVPGENRVAVTRIPDCGVGRPGDRESSEHDDAESESGPCPSGLPVGWRLPGPGQHHHLVGSYTPAGRRAM